MEPVRLNPDQWDDAIAEVDGPQLLLAGPGTGKTEFLARRAAALITGGVSATDVAVLTFSRRAARRLTDRIAQHTAVATPRATTFHSLAYRLLEANGPAAFGWSTLPTLLTGPEQVTLVRQLLADEPETNWSPTFRPILHTQTFAREVADFIMRSQEYLLSDPDLAARCADRPDWRGLDRFRRRYLSELERRGRLDYGTLLARAVGLLADQRGLTAYGYVIVDEYQDTTAAQATMIDHLATPAGNVIVAGDPAQSIYRFRGAEPGNLDAFRHRHPDARVWELARSFRCPAVVLDAGRTLLSVEDARLHPEPARHAGSVEAYVFSQASEEAEWIAGEVERMHLIEGTPLARIGVLVRTKRGLLNELSRALSRRSIAHNAPSARLVDHPAVQTVFDLAYAATHDGTTGEIGAPDVDRAMRRVLLGPLFSLTLGAERRALRTRHLTGHPWSQIVSSAVTDGDTLGSLLADSRWATDLPASAGFWHLWASLPQFERTAHDPHRRQFRAALASFSQSLGRLAERDPTVTLIDYRRQAEADDFEAEPLLTLNDPTTDQVTLTTLHQAKGLEYDAVFIADAVEGLFPDLRRSRSLLEPRRLGQHWTDDPLAETAEQLTEEARLAYTATTRSRARVVWTATSAGFDHGDERPSRYLTALAGPELGPPRPEPDRPPITPLDAEAHLRRMVADPSKAPGRRLAAVDLLVARPNEALRPATSFTSVRPRGPDTGVIDPPVRLSPSQAESYATCPRRYALERRLAVDSDYGPYGTFGTLMHSVLELAEAAAMDRGDARSTIADAVAALDDLFEHYELGIGEIRRAWLRRGHRLIEAIYTDWPRPNGRARLLEHELALTVDGVEWIGRADRIESDNGIVRVVDYKTSTTVPSKQDAATSLQLGFYLLAARQDPAVAAFGEPTEAEMWFPLAKNKPEIRALDPGQLPDIEAELARIAEGIHAEDWQPDVGPHCERCPVRLVCPAFPEGREAYVR